MEVFFFITMGIAGVLLIIAIILGIKESIEKASDVKYSRMHIDNNIASIKQSGVTKEMVRTRLESYPTYVNYEINLNYKQKLLCQQGYTFELYILHPKSESHRIQKYIVLVMYNPEGYVCTVEDDFSDHPGY